MAASPRKRDVRPLGILRRQDTHQRRESTVPDTHHSGSTTLFRALLVSSVLAATIGVVRARGAASQDTRVQARFAEAEALLDRGDAPEALALIQRAVDASGAGSAAAVPYLRMRAYIEGLLRRNEAALATYREVLEHTPSDERSVLEVAKQLHTLGRYDEAKERYQAFIHAAKPGSPIESEARANLANLDVAMQHAGAVEKKIHDAHVALYWLAAAAALVLFGTLTVIRRLCR